MNKTFLTLLDGYLTDALSDEEQLLFLEMIEQPANRLLLEEAIDKLAADKSFVGVEQERLRLASLERLQARMQEEGRELVRTSKLRFLSRPITRWAAAIVLIFIATGIYMWLGTTRLKKGEYASLDTKHKNEISPVVGSTTLTLADGSTIQLDSLDNGTVTQQHGVQLFLNNGQLSYQAAGNNLGAVTYNTITTSRGKKFVLMLPDGSKVWLNAASTLRFPTVFPKDARHVELIGEAYFEIAKNAAAPFKVKIQEALSVEVLGTHFNIMAYQDERNVTTTLLEGAVRVSQQEAQVTLKPGQQSLAFLNKEKAMEVREVDVTEAVAWKEDRFEFYGNIKDIMRQLQRWYDISEVEYKGNITNSALVATISRSKNLSEVLDMLQRTGSIHFVIEGNKVIVMP